MIRRQLPAYSPLTVGAVAHAVWATVGSGQPANRKVEGVLRSEYAPRHLLLTDSGTSALTLALRAVRSKFGDRPIALPAYTCYDVATAAAGADIPVLLYDVSPRDLGPDLESLEEALSRGASAVVVAHLYGVPACLDQVVELARKAGATVIEDAAQAAGGQYRGRNLGSLGALSVLSFGRGKGTTGGGGGALMVHERGWHDWVAEIERTLSGTRSAGWVRFPALLGQWLFGRPAVYGVPAEVPFLELGETVYRDPKPPEMMPHLSAGALCRTLDLRAHELSARRRHARWLRRLTAPMTFLSPVEVPPSSEPGYLRFPVLADERTAERLSDSSARGMGIMPGYPRSLDRLAALRDRWLNASQSLPGARTLTRRLFTLPTHSKLDDHDRERLAAFLHSVGTSRPSPRAHAAV